MIKTLKNIAIALTFTAMCGCSNFLDKDQYGYFSYEEVFANKNLIDAFFATTYASLPIEDFNYVDGYFWSYPNTGAHTNMGWAGEINGSVISETVSSRLWAPVYTNIYYSNRLIEGLPTSDALTDSECKELIAEARFLRAYSYYFLVRFFGGVPIVDEPIEYTSITADMKLPRAQEEEVWDFILSDIEYAIENLPEEKIYGRATKYVAVAFKSRACLYAASIAKYGSLQEAYCVGINPYRAVYFYEESMAASKQLIDEGGYSLYNIYDDPTYNFNMSFLDADSSPEVIFARGFDYFSTGYTHSHDAKVMPYQLDIGYGEQYTPFLDVVEEFEFADGRPASLIAPESKSEGTYYKTIEEMFEGRDPRLEASIVLPNSELLGEQITIQDGVMCDGEKTLGNYYGLYFDKVDEEFVSAPNENTVTGTGKSGGTLVQNTGTGFFTRKYVDINLDEIYRTTWSSQTDYIVIRLAEMYMNYVEAAMELETNLDLALEYINRVKSRAGVAEFTSTASLVEDRVTAERRAEFFFEGQKFWDLIRRRTLLVDFETVGTDNVRYGLEIYYDYENDQYYIERNQIKAYGYSESRYYYQSIPDTEIAKHSWANNPGY